MSWLDRFKIKKSPAESDLDGAETKGDRPMDSLTIVEQDGHTLFTTSEAIAEGAGIQHKNTLELIERSQSDLEEFGQVAFETRPGYNNAKVRVAKLNEQQATLLLTFLRNTDQVRTFKKSLVKAFYDMAAKLNRPLTIEEKSLQVIGELQQIVSDQRKAVEEMAPKAEAYEHFMEADGTYSVGAVGKMFGLSQQKLYDLLRNESILIPKGHMRNTPYKPHEKHFRVTSYEYQRKDGTRGVSYTTRVQPHGVDFIRRKLDLKPITAPLPDMEATA